MRTAITVATQHDGAVVFLSDPTVPIDDQKREMKRFKALGEHAEFCRVELWESGSGIGNVAKLQHPSNRARKVAAPEPTKTEPESAGKRKK